MAENKINVPLISDGSRYIPSDVVDLLRALDQRTLSMLDLYAAADAREQFDAVAIRMIWARIRALRLERLQIIKPYRGLDL